MADLTVDDLALRYGDTEILQGVSVRVPPGKVVALLGPSGSGKTTLLRAVAGLETPYRGTIALGDKVFFDAERKIDLPAEARGLGLVFQSYALWPHRTVFENVAYGLKLRKVGTAEITRRVEQALTQIGLGDLAARYPHQLVGRAAAAGGAGARAGLRAGRHPARRAVVESRCQAARGGPRLAAAAYRLARSLGAHRDPRPDRGDGDRRPHHAAQRRRDRAGRLADRPLPRAGDAVRGRVHGQQQPPRRARWSSAPTRPP